MAGRAVWGEEKSFQDYKAGEICRSYQARLDERGELYRVDVKVYAVKGNGAFCCLVVSDSKGKMIWKSPEKADPKDPMFFGGLIWGESFPQIIGDMNGDEKVELVAPAPVSDIRPVPFRVFTWDGKSFHPLFTKVLLASKDRPEHFRWTAPGPMEGRWIHSFVKFLGKGTLEVNIWTYRGGASEVPKGRAVVAPESGGFRIVKWIEPLR